MNPIMIGQKIRALRKKENLTQAAFASKVFPEWVNQPTIRLSRLENGCFNNCVEQLLYICVYCHIRLSDLISDTTDLPSADYDQERSIDNFQVNFVTLSSGLSKTELSNQYQEAFGETLPTDTIKKYRQGKRFPSLENLSRLSLICHVPVDAFFQYP